VRIGIAGYGTIGQLVHQIFGTLHEITIYDPPLGFNDKDSLNMVDFVFLCVPTISNPDGSCDTHIVEELVASINPKMAIICHSTVAIGTTERLINTLHKPLVYVPEYAGETPIHPYRQIENRDFFIYGGYEPEVSNVKRLFETVYGNLVQHRVTQPTVAETVKYMENCYLAMKVTFCNEFFDLAKAAGVNYEEVRDLFVLDKRMNPSHTSVTPERGYGGKCLPKDVAAACVCGERLNVSMELMRAVQRANERQRRRNTRI
jgi:UDPglucose 6-dehydrogenase